MMSSGGKDLDEQRSWLSWGAAADDGAGETGSAESPCAAWFECDPAPVFIIGCGALLRKANASARRLLEAGGVELRAGRISFVDLESRRCFTAAVLRVLSGPGAQQTLIVRANNGQWRRITLRQCPGDPSCAFLVFGAAESDLTSIRALWKAFGLSPAEREVLQLLSDGFAPKEIAMQLGISTYTVRAHLRSLYLKANVRGISGLIRECSRLSA
jgi:DNA-binding CsgD family transcriptional regulator